MRVRPHENQIISLLDAPGFPFESDSPAYAISHAGSYARSEKVDPAPCYAHHPDLVRDELAHLQAVAPLPFPLAIFLLSHESTARTNGHYQGEYNYSATPIEAKDGSRYPPVGIIVLSGKRIPIHPAMTRYLVSHEYGHAVQYHLERQRGMKTDAIKREYHERCRPDASFAYGCGKWHAAIGELFANDFRILIARREVEFWPHQGFERPERNPAVVAFWKEAEQELLEQPDEAAA